MEQSFVEAAQSGDTDALYGLLKQNPFLLENIDKVPFVDTPLHFASFFGSTHFAIEILTLKPSFGRKLNPDGFSPLDLALRSGQTQTVRRLVHYDPELIRVKGKERFTPLHYVAQANDANLLALFLSRSPKSIEDLNVRGETAVHVAVKNRNFEAFKVILGWLHQTENEQILNWEDENGNTVLQIAAATNNYEVVRLLIQTVRINHKNHESLSALDLLNPNETDPDHGRIRKILRSVSAKKSPQLPQMERRLSEPEHLVYIESLFRRKLFRRGEAIESRRTLSGDTRNALLVVAVLIATAAYQAILSPPGGLTSTGDTPVKHSGKAQMGGPFYPVFMILNTLPFFASLGMIVTLLPKTPYNPLLMLPLISLLGSYTFSAAIISPRGTINSSLFPVYICILLFLLFVWTVSCASRRHYVQASV